MSDKTICNEKLQRTLAQAKERGGSAQLKAAGTAA